MGKWKIRNQFYSAPIINKWGMIYFGSKPNKYIIDILKSFEQQLPSVRKRFFFDNAKYEIFIFDFLSYCKDMVLELMEHQKLLPNRIKKGILMKLSTILKLKDGNWPLLFSIQI